MGGVVLLNGILNWRNILEKTRIETKIECECCNSLISISEAKTEGRIAIENDERCVLWCKCGKLNVIRKGAKNGETQKSSRTEKV